MSSNLISTPLDECHSWRESTALDITFSHSWWESTALNIAFSARYHWSVSSQSTSFPLRHWNLRNLAFPQECYLTNIPLFRLHSFARLYNAAILPAPRLRSASSLAIFRILYKCVQHISSSIPKTANKARSFSWRKRNNSVFLWQEKA